MSRMRIAWPLCFGSWPPLSWGSRWSPGDPDSEPERDLDQAIDSIKELPVVTKVVTLNEANDPYDLSGRAEGVSGVAIVYDSRLKCPALGIECGAIIEEWPNADEARTRSESVQAHHQGMPMLGFEYHFLEGETLLRVVGKLSQADASEYEQAFAG